MALTYFLRCWGREEPCCNLYAMVPLQRMFCLPGNILHLLLSRLYIISLLALFTAFTDSGTFRILICTYRRVPGLLHCRFRKGTLGDVTQPQTCRQSASNLLWSVGAAKRTKRAMPIACVYRLIRASLTLPVSISSLHSTREAKFARHYST